MIEDSLYNNVYLNALQFKTTDIDRNWCIKNSSVESTLSQRRMLKIRYTDT